LLSINPSPSFPLVWEREGGAGRGSVAGVGVSRGGKRFLCFSDESCEPCHSVPFYFPLPPSDPFYGTEAGCRVNVLSGFRSIRPIGSHSSKQGEGFSLIPPKPSLWFRCFPPASFLFVFSSLSEKNQKEERT
jgi:hypothetical protein